MSIEGACVKLFRKAKWANGLFYPIYGLKMVKDNKPYRKDFKRNYIFTFYYLTIIEEDLSKPNHTLATKFILERFNK